MKTKKNILSFILVVACLFSVSWLHAQVSPPGTYTTLPSNSSIQTQTLSSTSQWFKYSTDSLHTALSLKLLSQGSQYALSTLELYRFDGTNLQFVFRDTLRADSSLSVYATDLSRPQTLYFKVSSVAQVCGTCAGPLYPVVSIKVMALPVGCSAYTQPSCQLVQDGGFEFSKLNCVTTPASNTGACNNDPYVGFSNCFWSLPLNASTISCSPSPIPFVGTSDYYYICNGPLNGAHTNNGYAGLFFYTQTTGYAERQYREYMTQPLASQLVPGKSYTITMWVKRDASLAAAVSNIQVLFNNTNLTQNGFDAIVSPAGQIVNMSSSLVTSTSWVMLSASFVAGSNYSRMTIGNFVPVGSSNATIIGNQPSIGLRSAYYFIDDVSIKPTPTISVTPGNPISACAGHPTTITASMGAPATFLWNPAVTLLQPDGSVVSVSPSVSTTYVVSGTDAIGCSTYTNITVNVVPQPTVTATPSSTILCGNGSATLTASGATSYTWSTGATTSSIVVSPTLTTMYTVTGSTGTCPPSSANVVVTSYPTPTVTAVQNVTTCPGANSIISAAGGTGVYSWSPGGATTASVVVSPTVSTTYTLTSAVNGCTLSATALVTPVTCCSMAPLFTATSGTITGGTYVLNSPLTLTNHLVLQGVTIFMGTNAEIIVPNGLVLGMFTTHLLGCPQMWKGIRCTGTAASIIAVKNTMIEDAIIAIDLANVSTPVYQGNILFLENMTFNKNYTAVNVENYNASNGHFPMFMGDALFTSRKLITPDHLLVNPALTVNYNWPTATNINTLKGFPSIPTVFNPDVNLLTTYRFSVANFASSNCEVPYVNTVGQQGVRLKNVNASGNYNGFLMNAYNALYDGTTFDFHNLFDNLHFGINATNSNVYVSNSIYQYMSQYVSGTDPNSPGFKTYTGGVGIHSENTLSSGSPSAQAFSLTAMPYQGKDYNKSGNFFFNNAYGIKTSNIQYVKASLNVFHSNRIINIVGPFQANAPVGSGQYALYMKSNDYRDIQVRNNFTANINNGMIFMADANRLFSVFYTTNAGSVTVQSNQFKANYGNTISNQSMAQAVAIDNMVSPNVVNLVTGNTANIVVSDNNISKAYNGIEASNWNQQRIIVSTNTVSLLDNGSVNTSQYGIQHSNNTGDQIFNNMISGFNTSKVKVIGISAAENKSQSVWCNSTEKSYYGIVFRGSQNLTSWKNNTMQAHQRGMLLDNTTIGQQGASGQPIANLWAGTWSGAFKLYVNLMDPGSAGGNSKLYMNSLPVFSESGASPASFNYKTFAPQSLFLTGGFSTISCPYTKLTANPLALQAHKANLHNIVADSLAYGKNVNANRKNGRLAVYRAMIEDSTLAGSDSLLNAFKNAADASNIGQLFRIEQAFYEGGLSSAETMINSLSPVDTVEATQKKVYQLYLRSKQNNFSVSDRNVLIDLALACPAEMGVGVYQARAMLNSIFDVFYHFENDCGDVGQPGQRRGREENEPEPPALGFLLYPNPGTGTLYVSTEGMGVDSYRVTVYDIAGKAIFIKDNQEGGKVNALDLNLSNGVYLMQLTDSANGDVYKQKFIIQK